MKRIYLQLFSISITFLSAIYMLLGSVGIGMKEIAELAKTKYDYNIDVAKNLVQQQIDTKISIFLIIISLLLQILSMKYPLENNNNMFKIKPILIAIAASLVLFYSLRYVSNKQTITNLIQIENILKKEIN